MGDLDGEIKRLLAKTAETRHQFLKAEVQTCFTALEMAKYELSVRNFPVAEKEIATVEQAVRTVLRFLREEPAEQRIEVETEVAKLQAMLAAVKSELNAQSR